MGEDENVKLHTYEYVKLGGARFWDWRQEFISVPYWRLYWNSCEGGFVKIGLREVELGSDKVVLLSPNTVYSTRTVKETGHLYMHFSTGWPLVDVQPQMFEFKCSSLTSVASQIAENITRHRDNWKIVLQIQILINSTLLCLPEYAVPHLREYDPRIEEAIATIENSHFVISNRKLARSANMSINGFLQLFRNETGVPPQTYSRRKRLDDASKMLHFSDAEIDEIAKSTGFCDRYHFSRAFKQEFGLGPARFRRQAQMLRNTEG